MLRTCSVVPFFRRNCSCAQAWCKIAEIEFPKVLRNPQIFTILISKSLSRAGGSQILRNSISKIAPTPPISYDFDFQIVLARRRGTNFLDILGNRSFATPDFWTYLCEPSKPRNDYKIQDFIDSYPPKPLLSHIYAIKYLYYIDAAKSSGNFQYNQKLDFFFIIIIIDQL